MKLSTKSVKPLQTTFCNAPEEAKTVALIEFKQTPRNNENEDFKNSD